MNKILILTTEGCEACDIAKSKVEEAIFMCKVQIKLEVKDWHEMTREFIVSHKIKDFPAVLYMINGKVVNKAIGTYPSIIYLRWIDIYFKK